MVDGARPWEKRRKDLIDKKITREFKERNKLIQDRVKELNKDEEDDKVLKT